MYKPDLALDNQQWLICHKTKPNQTKLLAYLYIGGWVPVTLWLMF